MKITLTGITAELVDSGDLDVSSLKNVEDLKNQLLLRAPELHNYKIKVAVNSVLAEERQTLDQEDEVFVFNAYAGG
jgi:molybdopterin converting factor small subunit